VPVDRGRLGQRVLQGDAQSLALARADLRPGDLAVVGHRLDRLAGRELPRDLAGLEVNRTRAVVPSRGDVATADEVRPHAGRRRPGSEAGEREKEVAARTGHGHFASTMRLISCGEANTMDVRSPCMPAGTSTGLPRDGPSGLESVLKRRLNSQKGTVRPSSVVTR